MKTETEIEEILIPLLEGLNLSLVELSVGKHRGDVKINMVLYKSGGISLDDLTSAQKTLRPRLELEIDRDNLSVEISSPGLSRVIKNAREYEIFKGRDAKVLIEDEWMAGKIIDFDGTAVTITAAGVETRYLLREIRKGKLA